MLLKKEGDAEIHHLFFLNIHTFRLLLRASKYTQVNKKKLSQLLLLQ